jgi:hypothetical protein
MECILESLIYMAQTALQLGGIDIPFISMHCLPRKKHHTHPSRKQPLHIEADKQIEFKVYV